MRDLLNVTALLDTNLCVRALRDRPLVIRERLKARQDAVCLSTVVLYELYVGAAQSRDPARGRAQVESFAEAFPIFEFDAEAAYHAADIRAVLEKKGEVIGPCDLLIAGHARSLGLTVITGNLREFSRVEGLRCEDWA